MPPLFFKTKGENKAPAEQHAAMNWPRKYGMARLAGSGSGRAEAAAANSFPGFLSNLLYKYLSVRRSHHIHRERLENLTLI